MTRKDDPFKMGLAMLAFQHASKREEYSNSIEPMPVLDEDETPSLLQPHKPSTIRRVADFALFVAAIFTL